MPTITDPVAHFSGLANTSLREAAITDGTVAVTDAHRDAVDSVQDSLTVGHALDQKLAGLDANRIHLTKASYEEKRRTAINDATELSGQAARRYTRAAEAAETALLDSSLPKLPSDGRELLARQELEVALGKAQGPDVGSRVLGLANSGSPEVQAALGTPYARTALIARQVPNVDRILRDAKRVVATAGTTPEAQKASDGLAKMGVLGGAQAAALAAVRHSLPRS